MRPRLKSALRGVQRDERSLQFGSHPLGAVVLDDVAPAVRRLIESLDGTRTVDQIVAEESFDEGSVRALIRLLAAGGVIEDAATPLGPLRTLSPAERERLRPDLDRLALTSTDGGLSTLERRHTAQIRIYGAGRVGAQIAVLLAASGVGHLCVVDDGEAGWRDVVPGGLGPAEIGMSREAGAVAAARRAAPGINAWTGRTASRVADGASAPDLAILAPVEPLCPLLAPELAARRVPHLLACAYEGRGTVGPLVVPGATPCLGCLDLARRDVDPSWPMVSARLGGHPPGEIACDSVLATLVAAQACARTLAFLAGDPPSGGVWDIEPDGRIHHMLRRCHPQCGCSRIDVGPITMVA